MVLKLDHFLKDQRKIVANLFESTILDFSPLQNEQKFAEKRGLEEAPVLSTSPLFRDE